MESFTVLIQDAKGGETIGCSLPFLPPVGSFIIVEGRQIKVKKLLIDYDDQTVTINGIYQ